MSDPKDRDQANSPDTLAQTGEAGIELNENQLEDVSGGLSSIKLSDKF